MRLVDFHYKFKQWKKYQLRNLRGADSESELNREKNVKQVAADGGERRCSCSCTGRASLNCPAGGAGLADGDLGVGDLGVGDLGDGEVKGM